MGHVTGVFIVPEQRRVTCSVLFYFRLVPEAFKCEPMHRKGKPYHLFSHIFRPEFVKYNQETGDVIHGHCSCKAGKGGRCKHVAVMLYQIIDYVQLELLEVPLSLTCTQVQQKWNVPHGEASDDAVLFEDIAFKKSSYQKDKKQKHQNESLTS